MTVRAPMERLAREICWLGFVNPKAAGCTKVQYWKRLSEERRQDYRREAGYFIRLVSLMDRDLLSQALRSHGESADKEKAK